MKWLLKNWIIMKAKNKKIVIIGGFGWQDIGDEAMPQSVIYNLRRTIPELDIVMLSPNPEYTTKFHGERSIPDINLYLKHKSWLDSSLGNTKIGIVVKVINRLFLRKVSFSIRWLYFLLVAKCYSYKFYLPIDKRAKMVLKELATSDLLFNNGGGNINTLLSGELYKQTVTIIAASFLGLPIIISGQTIGPISNKLHALLVKIALNRSNIITLRDKNVSMQRLKAIGINKPTMQITADDAITLPILSRDVIENLILDNQGAKWLKMNYDIIAVLNINADLKAMEKENSSQFDKEITLLSCVADKLIDEHNAKIILLPTDYCAVADDRFLLREIIKNMKHGAQVLIVEEEYNAIKLKSLISIADIAIGVRYHFNVFATSSGVPCIGVANGVYQKTKLRGLMLLYNLPECFIEEDMDKVEFDKVWAIITDVIEKRDKIARHLQKTTPILQKRGLLTIKRAVDLLQDKR